MASHQQNSQSFKVFTLNVNGLNDVRKRRLVFGSLRKFKRSIFLLQETHCRPGNARLWKSQWGSPLFLTEESGSVGGVATLFSRDLDPSFSEIITSTHHRFILTCFSLNGEEYRVANLYMPTSDKEKNQLEILEELDAQLDISDGAHIFLGGDFNVALHEDLDREGYAHPYIPNRSFRSELKLLLEKLDLGDLWRIQHPTTKEFTWSRSDKMARLDYIFAPINFPGFIKTTQPRTYAFSDHRMVGITVRPCEKPKGRGFWKLKGYLLDRQDFCQQVAESIVKGEEESQDLSPDTKWEYLKLCIRECAISFTKKLNQEQNRLEAELETHLLELEKGIHDSKGVCEEYYATKRELYQIQLLKARESMMRSRVKWAGEGERPTKYFLNLERKNFDAKTLSVVFDNEGHLLTEAAEILKFELTFFTEQYAVNPDNWEAQELGGSADFLPHKESPLSDLDRQLLNRELSLEELERALKDMKNGKSPGFDGLPPELYKKCWGLLGKHLLASFNYFFEKGLLTPDQRRGIISLIPKKGKDSRHINNCMLNSDYKVIAKVLAKRLSSVLPSLIHQNQTGFIPSRFIGDNIRNTQALLDFTKETGRSGLLVSLDFKAAFDSLDHRFLMRALESYNLGEYFLSWIATLYSASESCVLNGGQSSGWFPFQKGIRQGYPISPFLFALAVEGLADAIRDNALIRGIDLLDTHTKILQFADDPTLFLRDEDSLCEALQVIDEFQKVSGLGLNLQKTFGIVMGEILLES